MPQIIFVSARPPLFKLTNIIIYFSIPEIWQPVCLNDCRLYRRYKKPVHPKNHLKRGEKINPYKPLFAVTEKL